MIEDIIKRLQQLKLELDQKPSKEVLQAIDQELMRLQDCLKRFQPDFDKESRAQPASQETTPKNE